MEEKDKKEEKALEETKEMKKDINEIQKDIDEVKESVKEVKKRGTFHVILVTSVIILLFVAFALYGFASGVGYGVGKVKEVQSADNVYSFDNVSVEEVVEIFNSIQPMWECNSPYFTDKKYTVNDISNDMAYNIGLKSFTSRESVKSFSADEFDDVIDSILGKGYKFTHKTYESCPSYKYSNKIYKFAGDGCGGTCGPNNIEQIVGATRNGNELDIYVAVLFADSESDPIAYYKDYKHTQKVTNFTKDDKILGGAADTVENAKLGTIYKMIFNLEDDYSYVFVSSEPIS